MQLEDAGFLGDNMSEEALDEAEGTSSKSGGKMLKKSGKAVVNIFKKTLKRAKKLKDMGGKKKNKEEKEEIIVQMEQTPKLESL